MDAWSGSPEQQESARLKARRSPGYGHPYERAAERYLRLEAAQTMQHPVAEDTHADRAAQPAWPHVRRTGGPLRHERVEINGHDVEITEDAFGVTELHLA